MKTFKMTLFYQKLNVNPTAKHSEVVNSDIESFRKQEVKSNPTANKLFVDLRTLQSTFTQSS